MKQKMKIKIAGQKKGLVQNRAYTIRTGTISFYNPKTDYKRSAEKQRTRKEINET